MKRWRKVESEFVATTGQIITGTDNPYVRLVIKFIQRHLYMNRHALEFIGHSLGTFPLTLEELEEIWGTIEKNIQLLGQMIELTEEMLATTKGDNLIREIPCELSLPVSH